jgi:hypothetical protein
VPRLTWSFFPDLRRLLPNTRACNIGFRTAHIAVTGILLGGHAFDITPDRLLTWLWLSLATGLVLIFLEAFHCWHWFYQGRGILVLFKLLLLVLIPFLWDYRIILLLVVVVIASVGSHMPARFRYYSLVHGRVL